MLSQLINLRSLGLHENSLAGFVPNELGELKKLELLSLHNNLLEGEIPSALGWCTSLKQLSLSGNKFEGQHLVVQPVLLVHLPPIQVSSLTSSLLGAIGGIPPALGKCTQLQRLALHANRLQGTIPGAIGELVNLTELTVHLNRLVGPVPNEVGNLKKLRYFGLDPATCSIPGQSLSAEHMLCKGTIDLPPFPSL